MLEWRAYMTIVVEQELFVDLTRNQKLSINLNMTWKGLPCDLLSIDASDVSGATTHDVHHGLKKVDLNKNGVEVHNPETTTTKKSSSTKKQDDCPTCYGAENESINITCCHTCKDVKIAYMNKGWQFVPNNIKQCTDEFGEQFAQAKYTNKQDVEKLLQREEGCRLEGYITANKIAGNIHLAPGISFEQNHQHYHSMENLPIEKLNTDHYFDVFSFGDEYPNQFNPLEIKTLKVELPEPEAVKMKGDPQGDIFAQLMAVGFFGSPEGNTNDEITQDSKSVSYRYFLKIVPTTYEYLNGRIVNNTYQYSVTRSAKRLTQLNFGAAQLPGVFVSYELSPIMIKYIERSQSFSHFLTSCCAIIGGLFTVAGMLDALTFRYYNMYKKYQMNKLT